MWGRVRLNESERRYCSAAKASAMRVLSEQGFPSSKLSFDTATGTDKEETKSFETSQEETSSAHPPHQKIMAAIDGSDISDKCDDEMSNWDCQSSICTAASQHRSNNCIRCDYAASHIHHASAALDVHENDRCNGSVVSNASLLPKPSNKSSSYLDLDGREENELYCEEFTEFPVEEALKGVLTDDRSGMERKDRNDLTGQLIENLGIQEREDWRFNKSDNCANDGGSESELLERDEEENDVHQFEEGCNGRVPQHEKSSRCAETTDRPCTAIQSLKSGTVQNIGKLSMRSSVLKDRKRIIEEWNELRRSRILIEGGKVADSIMAAPMELPSLSSSLLQALEKPEGLPSRIDLNNMCGHSCADSTLSLEIKPLYLKSLGKENSGIPERIEEKGEQNFRIERIPLLSSVIKRESIMRTVNEDGPIPLSLERMSKLGSGVVCPQQHRRGSLYEVLVPTQEPIELHQKKPYLSQLGEEKVIKSQEEGNDTPKERHQQQRKPQQWHPAAKGRALSLFKTTRGESVVDIDRRGSRHTATKKTSTVGGGQKKADMRCEQLIGDSIKKTRKVSAPPSGRRSNLEYRKQTQVKKACAKEPYPPLNVGQDICGGLLSLMRRKFKLKRTDGDAKSTEIFRTKKHIDEAMESYRPEYKGEHFH